MIIKLARRTLYFNKFEYVNNNANSNSEKNGMMFSRR